MSYLPLLLLNLLHPFTPLPLLSLFSIMSPKHRCSQLRERKRENQPTSLSSSPSSSSPSPRPLAHERDRARPMDGRWGVCYARAPDPDTTQHTAPQATTAVLECDLFRILMPDSALRVCLCVCVEGGGHGWRDINYRTTCTARLNALTNCGSVWYFSFSRGNSI